MKVKRSFVKSLALAFSVSVFSIGAFAQPALAPQEKPQISPDVQALLYMKQGAEQRELEATASAFRFKSELDALKAKRADNKALADEFNAQIKKLNDTISEKDGELAIANTRIDEARNAMAACPVVKP